jgi:hypothetical protein
LDLRLCKADIARLLGRSSGALINWLSKCRERWDGAESKKVIFSIIVKKYQHNPIIIIILTGVYSHTIASVD